MELNNQIKTAIAQRSKFNNAILTLPQVIHIKEKYPEQFDKIIDKIKTTTVLRFGQIICNDLCPDYRDEKKCDMTVYVMPLLFGNCNMDPFYEESRATYLRLCENAIDFNTESN